jgi:GTP-binding protein
MRVHAKFLLSAFDAAQFPAPGPPEIAFLGRSNVGKSSVLNSLVGEKIARTSSTPGRTRSINFFEIRRPGQPRADFIFADLPGYGYAKLPREQMAEWPRFIEPYLVQREPLALCIALIDANVPPQQNDKQMIEWLRHHRRPFLVLATKSDRLSGNKLPPALRRLSDELQIEAPLAYSARSGAGRDELWRRIRESCAPAQSSDKTLAG